MTDAIDVYWGQIPQRVRNVLSIHEIRETAQPLVDRIEELEAKVKRLREAIQKWYDYGYDRGEAEKTLEGE